MKNITKKTLVQKICLRSGFASHKVSSILDLVLEEIMRSLIQKKRIVFRNFGIFEVIKQEQRIGRNPKIANHTVVIPPTNKVKFIPGKKMKEEVRKTFPFKKEEG